VIGLDSNVLLRYIMQDDPSQSPRAATALEGLTAENPGYVSHVVLAEIAWVLERGYKLSDRTISVVMTSLLRAVRLVVQDEAAVVLALRTANDGRGSFADALISVLSANAGCERTLTFDKRASRLPGFELI
jgi:predicted nucleic-acid-binding protein